MVFEFSISNILSEKIKKNTDKKANKKANKKIDNIKELSPKIRKRVKSMDNFMKFQWTWTL